MKANRQIIKELNKIAAKYSGYREPKELQNFYKELENLNVSVGMIANGNETCEWYLNGEEVENSLFVYQVYEGTSIKNDYNIYFS